MKFPSFEEFAELVRSSARWKRNERIDPDTQLLRDLKVNRKTRTDLLISIERHYGIEFPAEIYRTIQDIRSIRCEDANESPVIQALFALSKPEAPTWTVGRLYRDVLKEMSKRPPLKVVSNE